MDHVEALERVAFCEREIARLTAVQFDALVVAAGRAPEVEEFVVLDGASDQEHRIRIEDAAREEVAARVRWSPVTAQHRIDTARLLADALPATRAALHAGAITPTHVTAIVEAADRFAGRWADGPEGDEFTAACARLEERVLPVACRGTAAMTRAAARRAVLAVDGAGHERRRQRARCTRDVFVVDDEDGLSTLMARLSTVDAHALLAAVQARAAANADPSSVDSGTLTAGERRAAALRDLVLGTSGVTVALDVVIDLPTLLGLADAPSHLTGAGPISASEVRDLIADPAVGCTLRRLVTDPVTGHLLDRGRTTYAVPDDLRAFITRRDQTCRFPGCRRRADRCQIDHADPYDDDGETSRANLGALCTRHHQLKTHAGWRIIDSTTDGTATWHSPAGRTYQHHPPPLAA